MPTATIPSEKNPDKSGSMLALLNRVFTVAILLGLVMTALAAWGHAATAILWALASLAVGAFIGLLFGIPRVKQTPATGADPKASASAATLRSEVNNNLIEVSDWLTKIIVGVGLVQLNTLPAKLKLVATPLALCLADSCGLAAAVGIIVFFAFLGFLAGYINARTFISAMFDVFDAKLNAPEREQFNALKTTVGIIDDDSAASRPGQSLLKKSPLGTAAAPPSLATATLQTDLDPDDPNKAKFGGSPAAGGRLLQATIKPMGGSGSRSSACWVELTVSSTDPAKPLTGLVTFFLHPSFGRYERYDIKVENGVARDTILSWGAFTVGAKTDGGETKLELDLSGVPGGTKSFYEE